MKLGIREQVLWWTGGLVALVAILWLLGDAILPFVVGAAIAYFLDPVADRLERMGLSRVLATTLISIVMVLIVVLIFVLLVPVFIEQGAELGRALPQYVQQLRGAAESRFPDLLAADGGLAKGIESLRDVAADKGMALFNQVLSSSLAVIDFLLLVVVAPVVAFYLLLDWDRMVSVIDGWLPRDHVDTIRRLASEIDSVLAGFVRGQLSVCAILGTFYAVALVLIGLEFGVFIGLFAGLISFIPFVGAIIGGALAIGVALFQFWGDPIWILAVAAVFFAGQAVEGNVLTPYLVGSSVGLHPVWLMFALSAFGTLFGFLGLLIAVPTAAAIGVLGRFALDQYQASRLYTGEPGQ
ncbi:AI-2E family transporter [Oceanomicrobium pacificus]|uniref:AI-2E family transporter n=1 Tax=Oceanomicrobium pacificus TaxID=2692916 RepID=A0A6B0TVW6_9RHOB|nr:AI-2E family transporter [Oceanomicrobium pacificus]MXU65372.1 AI-2E family transporter [Oceanomicrobium pacificus]